MANIFHSCIYQTMSDFGGDEMVTRINKRYVVHRGMSPTTSNRIEVTHVLCSLLQLVNKTTRLPQPKPCCLYMFGYQMSHRVGSVKAVTVSPVHSLYYSDSSPVPTLPVARLLTSCCQEYYHTLCQVTCYKPEIVLC